MVDTLQLEAEQLDQLKARRDILASELKASRVKKYISMITTKGKLKGELSHLTIKQFRDFTGTEPRQSIIVDGKIPWHLAIDTIATEAGFKSDEDFRDAVLRAKDSKDELAEISRQLRGKREDVKKARKTLPTIDQAKQEGRPPVFDKTGRSTEIQTEVNGLAMKSRRNPSFWQVESDINADGKPDEVIRVRYAADAKKIVAEAARDFKEQFAKKHRISKQSPRITPRRPKLRR